MPTFKVFLTDDHAILLSGLVRIINTEDDLEVVGTALSIKETQKRLETVNPDLLIVDYNLPDGDGLSLIQVLKRQYPKLKFIMLSMHEENHLIKEILKEGIDGYVLKKDSHAELLSAIRSARDGNLYLSSDIGSMLVKNLNSDEKPILTVREKEILKLIAKEMTNRQIAEELFISERTVETHRKNILRKAGTNNLVGLIKFGYANNLI